MIAAWMSPWHAAAIVGVILLGCIALVWALLRSGRDE